MNGNQLGNVFYSELDKMYKSYKIGKILMLFQWIGGIYEKGTND